MSGNSSGVWNSAGMKGYRLAQIGCTKVGDNAFEINYSFDKDYVLKNLRITVTAETRKSRASPVCTGVHSCMRTRCMISSVFR